MIPYGKQITFCPDSFSSPSLLYSDHSDILFVLTKQEDLPLHEVAELADAVMETVVNNLTNTPIKLILCISRGTTPNAIPLSGAMKSNVAMQATSGILSEWIPNRYFDENHQDLKPTINEASKSLAGAYLAMNRRLNHEG